MGWQCPFDTHSDQPITWIEKMAADAPKQYTPPTSLLDKMQRNTQRNEMDGKNTSAAFFWFLAAIQVPFCATIGFVCGIPLSTTLFPILSHAFGSLLSWFILNQAMFFDVWGEVTIAIVFVWSYLQLQGPATDRQKLCTALAGMWLLRLGAFLAWRILVRGWDWRFAKLMDAFGYNMFCFVCQGTWVFLQCCCIFGVHSVNATADRGPLDSVDAAAVVITLLGLTIEHVSDMQKSSFNEGTKSGEQKTWIQSGLWRYSRHPNYFGENLSWVGMGLACAGCLPSKLRILCIVSPVWSCFFLVFTSLALLEKRLDKKFGGQLAYEQYKQKTSCLLLWPVGWGWFGPRKTATA